MDPKEESHNLELRFQRRNITAQATFNDQYGRFAHDLMLLSSRPFAASQVMIPDGEYKGLHAIIIRPCNAFPLMKLPAEIRNMIYQAFLGDELLKKGVFRMKTPFPGWLSISELDKQTRLEVLPILYGARQFQFPTERIAVGFIKRIQQSIHYLRDIQVTYSGTSTSTLFEKLIPCVNLRNLEIIFTGGPEGSFERVVGYFLYRAKPWLECFGRGGSDSGYPGLDILHISIPRYALRRRPGFQWNASVAAKFSERMRERLANDTSFKEDEMWTRPIPA
ncbi:MAG: hypothetical protein M1820_009151 [Bogoriella megaspora]|nr:MAG: hypothetical protein M1820_009151 [Bogoriella megaspora]